MHLHDDNVQFMAQMYFVIKDDDVYFDDNVQFMIQTYVDIKDDNVHYECMKNVSNVCCHKMTTYIDYFKMYVVISK